MQRWEERFEDEPLLAWKTEEGPRAKDHGRPLEAARGKETESPLDPQEEARPTETLISAREDHT